MTSLRVPGPMLARRERHALCDLALELGPDVPTLCGDWDARDLVAHLLVRENDLLASAGIAIPPLAGLTERAMAKVSRRPFPAMVATLSDPGLTPYRLAPLERLGNTLEYFVHHEDLRRAQPDWEPRDLPDADEDELWTQITRAGKLMARSADVPVVVRRSDRPATSSTLRRGRGPAEVTGLPSEIVLLLFGRAELADLHFGGPPAAVARLRRADFGM